MKHHLFKGVSLLLILIVVTFSACLDINNINDIDFITPDAEYAIPLINSRVSIESMIGESDDKINIEFADDGLAILSYKSDIVRKQANDIFKPIVFPGPIYFEDSISQMRFDQIDNYVVEKGIIRGDSIQFGFTNSYSEDVNVTMGIKEASKNGVAFIQTMTLPPNTSLISTRYSLKGLEFVSPDNSLNFFYDARTPGGERVLLDDAKFEFTYFLFDYVQGFLGKNTQKLNEHKIDVNVFDQWESGLLEFYDPQIKVRLDNSFGFPVKALINHFEITNILGETIPLESTIFDEDIFFEYPGLDEVGEVKSSEFVFNKDNSNFASAFNQKVTRVSYDVDAQANPENDPNSIGFFTFDSYYLLNVAVELPMQFKAESFQLAHEIPIETLPVDIDLVDNFELKSYISNLFPVDIHTQLFFLDENEQVIDSLFENGERYFKAASVSSDGTIEPGEEVEPMFFGYDENRKDILFNSKFIGARIRFSTENNPEEWTRIIKGMGVDVKIGVKFKLK